MVHRRGRKVRLVKKGFTRRRLVRLQAGGACAHRDFMRRVGMVGCVDANLGVVFAQGKLADNPGKKPWRRLLASGS